MLCMNVHGGLVLVGTGCFFWGVFVFAFFVLFMYDRSDGYLQFWFG